MSIAKKILVDIIGSSDLTPHRLRHKLYKLYGIKISENEIRAKCFFNSKYVTICKGSFVNKFCQFHSGYSPEYGIHIGERCFVGMNVNFCCISHEIGNEEQRAGQSVYGKITVGDGTWIGANSVILPNVSIGSGCIIAAGSVIIKDCESNCMYAGNPAKIIKRLSSQ